MYFMAIAWLFGVPAYYLAESKGRSGCGYASATILLGIPVGMIGALGFFLPAVPLGILWLLPERPGAPGKAYLKITFACPECGKTVSFPRHREGVAELCPECGEIVRVQEDQYSPKSLTRKRTKPAVAHGEVCFECFGRPEPAHLLSAILNDNGVEARVSGNDAGGAMPYVGNTEGYRVILDVAQWDEAVKIEKECRPCLARDTMSREG